MYFYDLFGDSHMDLKDNKVQPVVVHSIDKGVGV